MAQPIVLYSTCTRLAYWIAETYFGGRHYVWCAPARSPDRHIPGNPPSSDPVALYRRYRADIAGQDQHSSLIEANRVGLVRGGQAKEAQGRITARARAEIEAVVKGASLDYFRPLLYVIPFAPVADLAWRVDANEAAAPISQEYIIEELPRSLFDPLDLE